jgi:hypothetical protein
MKITSDVFGAYLKCPTKCWLRAIDKATDAGTYPEWRKAENDFYQVSETRRLIVQSSNAEIAISLDMSNFKVARWRLTFSLTIQAQINSYIVESELHALERVAVQASGTPAGLVPIRFDFINKWAWTTNWYSLSMRSCLRTCWAAT